MASEKLGVIEAPNLQEVSALTSCGSNVWGLYRAGATGNLPVIVLLHGYPQTSFMWRHIVKHIPEDYALFIPDLPGYGRSTLSKTGHDKLTVGLAVLEALTKVTGEPISRAVPLILVGHDRGSRVVHRLGIAFSNNVEDSQLLREFCIAGICLMDTVPELEQWATFADPTKASGSFHWSLLPNMQFSIPLLKSYGGGKWCRDMIDRWCGSSLDEADKSPSIRNLISDNAIEAYASAFENPDVIRGTCEDYAASIGPDLKMQRDDERFERKIGGKHLPRILSIYSESYLAKGRNIADIWTQHVNTGTELECIGVGGGVGHFIAEEAAEEVSAILLDWLGKIQVRIGT